MRRIGLRFVIAVCYVACPAASFSQKAPDLSKPAGKDWLTIGGDWHNTRYSALTQINRSNVKNLKGAWVTHLGSGLGQKYSFEGTPIVKDGILYIATGNDDVFALDGRTGALIWEHRSGIEQNISTVCCGWDNRGVAVGDGKVFLDQVNGIAPSNEILRPPVASIRRTGEIRPAHGTARNHNQRKAMRAVLRNQIFHIGMTRHHLAVRRVEVLASDKEIALLGNSERSHLLRTCRAHERNNGGDGG
jgi:hypothetical protein